MEKISAALSMLTSRYGFEERLTPVGSRLLDMLMREIYQRQPIGHVEKIYGRKVSERLRHTSIEDGWRPQLEASDDLIKVTVGNISEHVSWVIRGTQHKEPMVSEKGMFFWWGDPHRWPPKDGKPPGPRRMYIVNHPGATKNPFVWEASVSVKPDATEEIRNGMVQYIRHVMSEAGLKEISR